jgi:enoyl-CoA hydratase/carnithine racemase
MFVVTINRPAAQNRINRATMRALIDAFNEADDDGTRVVVLTGGGDMFCHGGEIDGFPGGQVDDQVTYARAFVDLIERMATIRAPLVAAINGDTFAGGMGLVGACDLAVTVENATFGYPEIERGLFPMLAMAIAHPMLPAKVAFDLFYSGKVISSREMLALHLVNEVVPAGHLWQTLSEWAGRLASKSQNALALGRQAYYAMTLMSLRGRLEYAQRLLPTMLGAAEEELGG